MKGYYSIEDFICQEKRLPTVEEGKVLYESLWHSYITGLAGNYRDVALSNDSLRFQGQRLERMRASANSLDALLARRKEVVSVRCCERWGMYKICVKVLASRPQDRCKCRQFIPNFFEGWEVELVGCGPIEALLHKVNRRLRRTRNVSPCMLKRFLE